MLLIAALRKKSNDGEDADNGYNDDCTRFYLKKVEPEIEMLRHLPLVIKEGNTCHPHLEKNQNGRHSQLPRVRGKSRQAPSASSSIGKMLEEWGAGRYWGAKLAKPKKEVSLTRS